jgi:hypothetical protein
MLQLAATLEARNWKEATDCIMKATELGSATAKERLAEGQSRPRRHKYFLKVLGRLLEDAEKVERSKE